MSPESGAGALTVPFAQPAFRRGCGSGSKRRAKMLRVWSMCCNHEGVQLVLEAEQALGTLVHRASSV